MRQGGRATTATITWGLLLVVAFLLVRPQGGSTPGASAKPCTGQALVVAASNEKSGLLGEMAADYEDLCKPRNP